MNRKIAPYKRNKGNGEATLSIAGLESRLEVELAEYHRAVEMMRNLKEEFLADTERYPVAFCARLVMLKLPTIRCGDETDFNLNVIRYRLRWDVSLRDSDTGKMVDRSLVKPLHVVPDMFDILANLFPVNSKEMICEYEMNRLELNTRITNAIDRIAIVHDHFDTVRMMRAHSA